MPKGIRIHALSCPEVLRWEDIDVSAPSSGELRIRHTAIGLNFIDIYHRTGVYPLRLPAMLKGMTARSLLRRAYPVKKGDAILVHAAGGGVGLILCQWARRAGGKRRRRQGHLSEVAQVRCTLWHDRPFSFRDAAARIRVALRVC